MHPLHRPADLLEHRADVLGADECRGGPLERLAAPALELRVAPHRVLELRAVRLDGVPRPGGRADGPAEQHVVREDEVGREQRADGGRVLVDPGVELLARAVLDATHLVALVAVEDEDREEPIDVRADRGRAAEVVRLGAGLLAEHRHVVPLRGSTRGRAGACRRSSPSRRGGIRARAGCAPATSCPAAGEPARAPASRLPRRHVGPAPAGGRHRGRGEADRPRLPDARRAGTPRAVRRPGRADLLEHRGHRGQSVPSVIDAVTAPSGASWRSSRRTTTGRPGPSSPGRSPA